MDNVEASVSVNVSAAGEKSVAGLDTPITGGNDYATRLAFAFGTAAGELQVVAQAVRQLNASASELLDLTAAATPKLKDLIDADAAWARVQVVVVECIANLDDAEPNGSGVRAFGAATNGFQGWISAAGTHDIPQGGFYAAGVADATGPAVDGTHKLLKVLNLDSTNKTTYRITLMGV